MLGPTDSGWSLVPVVGHADVSLHVPPERTRLVVGELPGPFEKLCLGHWDAAIILRREVLCEKPLPVQQSPSCSNLCAWHKHLAWPARFPLRVGVQSPSPTPIFARTAPAMSFGGSRME